MPKVLLRRIHRVEHGLPLQTDHSSHRRATLAERMAFHSVPGVSIAVINDGQIEWAKGYGVREVGKPAPVTTDTLCQACSISKAVTAVAVLRLVQDGRLDLDEDVNCYLVNWQVPSNGWWQPRVTLRQLLTHSAGLSLPWSAGYHPDQEIPTLADVLDGAKPSNYPGIHVTAMPGLHFRYSGGGYCILQQLLMDVLGQPFPALMQELVLEPCDMHHSAFAQPLAPERWQVAASGHRSGGEPVAGKWRIYPELAAAGLWTTPSDLARLAINLQAARGGSTTSVLAPTMVEQMLTRQIAGDERGNMGLGIFLEGSGPASYFGHPGDNEGFTGRWLMHTTSGRGAVVLTNSDAGWVLQDEILAAVATEYNWPDRTLGHGAASLPSGSDERLQGEYELRSGLMLRVSREEPSLLLHAPHESPIMLIPAGEAVFRLGGTDSRIEFVRQANERVAALILYQEGSAMLALRRR